MEFRSIPILGKIPDLQKVYAEVQMMVSPPKFMLELNTYNV